ncbi:MAG: ABC transporter substrate-binding protein [Synechococcales bacterium]|nr:ABC transporter substrate-binding protein [Synechococcales bacterium]
MLGFVAALLLTLVSLSRPALTQEPVNLQIFLRALEATQMAPFAADFNAANPDIHLEMVEAPNTTTLVEDLYTSAFLLGDSPYDLVFMDIVWVPKFAAAGWLLPLGDRITEAKLNDYMDKDVDGGRYNGELYRMPFRSDVGMLYYRTDLLEQGGFAPPDTFEEMVEISQALQGTGDADWGYLWQGLQYEGLSAMFVEILEGFGGYWVNPDTLEVGLDRPEAIAAVEFLRNTIESGISPPGVVTYAEEEARRLFQSGEAIFMRNWPYVYSLAQESGIQGKYAIKPMVHQPNEDSGACQGGWGFGIAKTTPHPDEAWRVIEYFSQPEVQKQFVLETGYVPSRRSLFTDPDIVATYSFMPDLLNIIEQAVLRPPIAQYAQASDILQRYLSAALTGNMSAEAAMNAAARETRRLVETPESAAAQLEVQGAA